MSLVEAADHAEAPKVILGKYELGKLLGRGSSAKVYHARDLSTGRGVAVKCIPKQKLLDNRERGGGLDVLREVSSMRRLRHPNVVRLHEVLASRGHVYLVMEHARGGELLQRLASRGRLPENLARHYFRQLVSAVGYCHSRGVFHRDLKLENLLLSDAGHDGGLLKVSDFGLSAVSDSGGAAAVFRTLCGTPAYVAPEILAKKAYDAAKVDVWSCGVILYVLVVGYLPFNDHNLMRMYRKIYRGEYRCPKWVSPQLRRLLARLLDANPDTRADVGGVLEDPWLRADLDEREREKLGSFHHHDDGEYWTKVEEVGEREINAFDIISMSSGCNLSGLFGEGTRRDAFAADAGTAERALEEVEEVVRREGMEVLRMGLGLVVVKGGNRVGRVAVHRLGPEVAMVESVWTASEGWEWFREMKMRRGLVG